MVGQRIAERCLMANCSMMKKSLLKKSTEETGEKRKISDFFLFVSKTKSK